MIDIRYSPLFRITLEHPFFPGAPGQALALLPSGAGLEALRPTNGRFLPDPAGGTVYERGGDIRSGFSGPDPVSLHMVVRHPAFLGATALALPDDPAESVLYLSNRTPLGEDAEGRPLLLSGAEGPAVLPVTGAAFETALAPGQRGERLRLLHAADGRPALEPEPPEGGVSGLVRLDLRGVAEGRYRLLLDANEIADFYRLPGPAARILGVLEIFPGGPDQAVPASARAVTVDGLRTPESRRDYVLRFAARATIWRYWLVPEPAEADLSGWRVHRKSPGEEGAGAPDLRFGTPVRTAAGAPAPWRIDARELIALQSRPADGLSLVPPGEQASGVPLPIPRASASRMEEGGAQPVSDVYVRL